MYHGAVTPGERLYSETTQQGAVPDCLPAWYARSMHESHYPSTALVMAHWQESRSLRSCAVVIVPSCCCGRWVDAAMRRPTRGAWWAPMNAKTEKTVLPLRSPVPCSARLCSGVGGMHVMPGLVGLNVNKDLHTLSVASLS